MNARSDLIDMNEPELKRELGLIRTTMLGVGGTLSAANFVIIGHAASLADYAIVAIVFVSSDKPSFIYISS